MKWFNRVFLAALFTVSFISSAAMAATEVLTFDSDELRDRYMELTFELRCPKCQNQNVADSQAPISEDIRHKTYEMLHQGYTDQEIIDFMIDRYTEFVIYKPQLSVVTIWLWIVPGFTLLFGLYFLIRLTRRPAREAVSELNEDEQSRLKALMEEKS